MQAVAKKNIYRAIDANFNRLKEALRVCEDVCRFIFNDAALTRKLKNVRHELTKVISYFPSKELLSARDVGKDVGVGSIPTELRRKNVSDIFYANMQRAKESVRVLEEFAKLVSVKRAEELKKIRYQIYVIEKSVIKSG